MNTRYMVFNWAIHGHLLAMSSVSASREPYSPLPASNRMNTLVTTEIKVPVQMHDEWGMTNGDVYPCKSRPLLSGSISVGRLGFRHLHLDEYRFLPGASTMGT